MDNKCTKYEGLFVFSDEETLKSHLNECEECRLEQEKMDKVSDLINEVNTGAIMISGNCSAEKSLAKFFIPCTNALASD